MGFVVFSDFHANLWQEFSQPDSEFGNTRFKEMIQVLEKVIKVARENEADIIFTGDLFHQRSKVNTLVYNKIYELINDTNDLNWYLLRGNHDSVDNSLSSETSLYPFKGDHVKLISNLETFTAQDTNFVAVPYGDEVEDMKSFIKENVSNLDKTKTNILLGHFGVDGATTGPHSHRLEGAIGLGDLYINDFDSVLLGHYHNRQALGGNPNAVYVGNTMPTSFGDINQDKGVYYFDSGKGFEGLEFIPIKSKQFVTIEGSDVPDNLEEIMENNYVRFKGTPKQAEILKDNVTNVRVEVEREFEHNARLEGVNATSTPEEVVKAYAKEHYPNAVDKALECLREAI